MVRVPRRQMGSIVELQPGVYRVQVSAGRHPITGERYRPSEVVRGSELDAERALARLILMAGRIPESEVTVGQFLLEMYLPHKTQEVRARTVEGYRSKIETHVIPELGGMPLARLSPFVLDRWLAGVKGSDRTRLHAYRVLAAALNQAVRWRLLEVNPMLAVARPKVRRKAVDRLTAEEAGKYLEAFQGHRLEPVVVLALGAGLRRSEIAGLTWQDVDLDAGEVTVARGLHDHPGGPIVEDPKSETSKRVVSLPRWSCERLRGHRGLGPLVPDWSGAMRPRKISKLYDQRVEEAKLRRMPLRNLRHTHACLLLEAGVDLYVVSRRLGHSTTAVTELHYVEPPRDADRAAADALQFVPSANVRQDEEHQLPTVAGDGLPRSGRR